VPAALESAPGPGKEIPLPDNFANGKWKWTKGQEGRRIEQIGNPTVFAVKDEEGPWDVPSGGRPAKVSMKDVLDNPNEGFKVSIPALIKKYRTNIEWAIARLKKSTAGTRGILDINDIEGGPQLNAAVVALMAQAYANYINSNFPEGRRGSFIGADPRYFSKEFADMITRVYLANGISPYRDTSDYTATPVTSYMAYYFDEIVCGMEITSSHNPANQNGVKSSTYYGGVDTDDISAKIAIEMQKLYESGEFVRVAPYDTDKIKFVDAKKIYYEKYLSRVFTPEVIERMKKAMDRGAKFIFDGLYGVGGLTMEYYLDRMLADYPWREKIILINKKTDPNIGGIERPDPSRPETLEFSGALEKLATTEGVLIAVTADMDADRIGTAVVIPAKDVKRAKEYGLFISEMKFGSGTVNIVRFTPQQIFTLIGYERIRQALATGKIRKEDLYLLTSIPTSTIGKAMIEQNGGTVILTSVGFKNLGQEAQRLDEKNPSAIPILLMEESGGAIIAPLTKDEKGASAHRDKDTCVLALALYDTAAKLLLENKNMLDFYIDMAKDLGGLFYNERLDMYLPDQRTAEDIHDEAAGQKATEAKQEMIRRFRAIDHVEGNLDNPQNIATLASIFGKSAEDITGISEANIPNVVLLVGEGENWERITPKAKKFEFKDGEVIEVFHVGAQSTEGPCITVYDKNGRLKARAIMRPSGTESLVRVYMEIFEPQDNPHPERLHTYFESLLKYLQVDQYRLAAHRGNYLKEYERGVKEKYDTQPIHDSRNISMWAETIQRIERVGKAAPKQEAALKSIGTGSKRELAGVADGRVIEKYTIQMGDTLPSEPLALDRPQSLFVEEGEIAVLDENGGEIAKARKGEFIEAPLGKYEIRGTGTSVVYLEYEPGKDEAQVAAGFKAMRELLTRQAFTGAKRIIVHEPTSMHANDSFMQSKQLFKSKSDDTVGLYSYEIGVDALIGKTFDRDYEHVFVVYTDDLERINKDETLRGRLQNVLVHKIIPARRPADETKGVSNAIEIETAAVVLGLTDAGDIGKEQLSGNAVTLQRIMSRLVGEDVNSEALLALMGGAANRIAGRIALMLEKLVPLTEEMRRKVRARRELLWSL